MPSPESAAVPPAVEAARWVALGSVPGATSFDELMEGFVEEAIAMMQSHVRLVVSQLVGAPAQGKRRRLAMPT